MVRECAATAGRLHDLHVQLQRAPLLYLRFVIYRMNSGCHSNPHSNSDVFGRRAHHVAVRAVRIIAGRPDIPPIFAKESL